MSYRNQGPRNRRARRENRGAPSSQDISELNLPGPMKLLGNRKLFFTLAAIAGIAMVAGLLLAALGGGTTGEGPMQANEAPDVPIDNEEPSSTGPNPTEEPENAVQQYSAPPEMSIDTSKTYTATITTTKGEIQMELYPEAAPQTVNSFVFLAREGYYDGTPFLELSTTDDGGRFYAQAGDPTGTGFGTPGYSIDKEVTDEAFDRGAVGMGGAAANSNGGQFFISFDDFPALDGTYTIFGQVVEGLDVLDSLTLTNLTSDGERTEGDTIESVTISES